MTDLTADPRYIALRRGIDQLNKEQIERLIKHIEFDRDMLVDNFNYDPISKLWCPLAIALGVPRQLQNEGIECSSNEEAKRRIMAAGKRTNPKFSINPMKGVKGKFFRDKRLNDLHVTCIQIMETRTS